MIPRVEGYCVACFTSQNFSAPVGCPDRSARPLDNQAHRRLCLVAILRRPRPSRALFTRAPASPAPSTRSPALLIPPWRLLSHLGHCDMAPPPLPSPLPYGRSRVPTCPSWVCMRHCCGRLPRWSGPRIPPTPYAWWVRRLPQSLWPCSLSSGFAAYTRPWSAPALSIACICVCRRQALALRANAKSVKARLFIANWVLLMLRARSSLS